MQEGNENVNGDGEEWGLFIDEKWREFPEKILKI